MRYRHDWDTEEKRNRLYGRRWRKARAAFLMSHPLCVMCKSTGNLVAADVVDHKVPHKGDEALFWDQSNWQALCERHHNSDKAQIEIRGYSLAVGDDGWPLDPEHPANKGHDPVSGKSRPEELKSITVQVFLVCGPPASGKSTWCKNEMHEGDTLIDFDDIDAVINGIARRPGRLIVPILRERNIRLLTASKQKTGRVFLPITGASLFHRDWWRSKLGNVTTVLIDTSIEECIARIELDALRKSTSKEQIEAVQRWFKEAQRDDFDVIIGSDKDFIL